MHRVVDVLVYPGVLPRDGAVRVSRVESADDVDVAKPPQACRRDRPPGVLEERDLLVDPAATSCIIFVRAEPTGAGGNARLSE